MRENWDAVVVGAGPNGLAAAITLARAGLGVLVLEAEATAGGGTRSGELTLTGFVHDVCSAVHPLARSSPFFRTLPLADYGLEWVDPPAPLAHPFDDGTAVTLERPVDKTAEQLGRDAGAYTTLLRPISEGWERLAIDVLRPAALPGAPLLAARFGVQALRTAAGLARSRFRTERARALFAGLAGHSMLPLEKYGTAAFGLVLAAAGHAVGWPIPRGGSQRIADALTACLRSFGGEIRTSFRVDSLDQLPTARAVLLDVTPRQLLRIAAERLPSWYRAKLARYRYGLAACKVDWALDGPIPWTSEACRRAATVHLGGTLEEIAESERQAWLGEAPARPLVLLAQPSLFDSSRAPAGRHTAWAYCHVPNGSVIPVHDRIEAQVERFAPGFRDRILSRHVMAPADLERHNANLVGGDINGGAQHLAQAFLRPTWRMYRTPAQGVYLCSASTPPGGGVHGLCGFFAARAALRDCFGR